MTHLASKKKALHRMVQGYPFQRRLKMKFILNIVNLPQEVLKSQPHTALLLLQLIVNMALEKDPQTGKFISKDISATEWWFAKRLGRSREWISKSLKRLEQAGLIQVIRQKAQDGTWKRNIYRIGHELFRILGMWRQAVKAVVNFVKSGSQVVGSTFKKVKGKLFQSSQQNKVCQIDDAEVQRIRDKKPFEALQEIIKRIEERHFKEVEA
jgi:DNA-binding PadR family transcriptional regulator